MKSPSSALLLLSTFTALSSAQLLYPNLFPSAEAIFSAEHHSSSSTPAPPETRDLHVQKPDSYSLPSEPDMASSAAEKAELEHKFETAFDDKPPGTPLLSDVLPLCRTLSIYTGFTRTFTGTSNRLGDREVNTTILAPSDAAISRLPRKPWEDPDDAGESKAGVFEGILGEDRASRNLRRFVDAHLVGESPWEKGKKVKTLLGNEIWWEEAETDGEKKRKIMPDGVEVQEVRTEVANGQLWILRGVINY